MPASKTYVLGITGGIGCGKSEAARFLESLGAKHIDADKISHKLTEKDGEALPRIREVFGDSVFNEDGTLNRRALADCVFSERAGKLKLEGILHPMIQRVVMDEIDLANQNGVKVTVLNVPLLFESGMDVLCSETWTMSVDPQIQVKRVMERDGLTEEQALARIAGQMTMEERNARANRVVDTSKTLDKTQAELSQMYNQLLKKLG